MGANLVRAGDPHRSGISQKPVPPIRSRLQDPSSRHLLRKQEENFYSSLIQTKTYGVPNTSDRALKFSQHQDHGDLLIKTLKGRKWDEEHGLYLGLLESGGVLGSSFSGNQCLPAQQRTGSARADRQVPPTPRDRASRIQSGAQPGK